MKVQVSKPGAGPAAGPPARPPVIARGFSKASLVSSGENSRLRTVPRIVRSRVDGSHTVVPTFRVALHTLRPSSDGQAARRPSCDITAVAGGADAVGAGDCCAANRPAAASSRVNETLRSRLDRV